MANPNNNKLLTVIIIIIIAIAAYGLLTMPDRRTTTERVGDAIHALPQGVDKAGRELEHRTPGERIGDAVKDAGDDIKRDTAPKTQ